MLKNVEKEILSKLVSQKDIYGRTILHFVAANGKFIFKTSIDATGTEKEEKSDINLFEELIWKLNANVNEMTMVFL